MITPFAVAAAPAVPAVGKYAHYIEDIYWMLWVACILLATLAVAFVVFAVQKYWDRKEDQKRRLSMDAAVAALMGLVTVLDVIKANVERQLSHATATIKDEVKKTPDATAAKVAEKLDEIKLGESGVGLKVPPGGP